MICTPRYQRLMLDVARSMVTTHKQSELAEDDLQDKAEDLVKLNVPECSKARPFLSENELRHFMRDAGLKQAFIDEQIKNMREARAE